MKGKKFDFLILIFLNAIGVIYALLTKNLFIGKSLIVGLVFLIPVLFYLNKRQKKQWKKIFFSTLVFGGLFGFFFEFIQEFNHSYSVISSVFPFKLFNVLPPDNVIGHMMMTLYTMLFYEHFIARRETSYISHRFVFITVAILVGITVMLFLFLYQPSLLRLKYPYFSLGILAITPLLCLEITQPKFIKDVATMGIYFFFFYFIIELLAVRLGWWIYPGGNYVGWVRVFDIQFPFEELFFWMMFYAPALISYRELFIET